MECHIEKYNNEKEIILKYDKNYKSNYFIFLNLVAKVVNVRHKALKLEIKNIKDNLNDLIKEDEGRKKLLDEYMKYLSAKIKSNSLNNNFYKNNYF